MKKLTVSMTKPEVIGGYIYLALQLTILPVALMLLNLMLGSPLSEAQINFVFFCVNFLCVTVIFHKFLLCNCRIALADPGNCLFSAFCGFCLYWMLAFVVGMFIVVVYPNFSNVNDDSISELVQQNTGLMIFGAVVLVPVTEELLYRGLIFRGLYNRNRLAAYVISTAIFAALHVVGYISLYDPLHLALCFLQYIPAGLCLGWAYARANTILAPILIHVAINLIGTLSMR